MKLYQYCTKMFRAMKIRRTAIFRQKAIQAIIPRFEEIWIGAFFNNSGATGAWEFNPSERILNEARGRHDSKFGRYPVPIIFYLAGTHRYPKNFSWPVFKFFIRLVPGTNRSAKLFHFKSGKNAGKYTSLNQTCNFLKLIDRRYLSFNES